MAGREGGGGTLLGCEVQEDGMLNAEAEEGEVDGV